MDVQTQANDHHITSVPSDNLAAERWARVESVLAEFRQELQELRGTVTSLIGTSSSSQDSTRTSFPQSSHRLDAAVSFMQPILTNTLDGHGDEHIPDPGEEDEIRQDVRSPTRVRVFVVGDSTSVRISML